MARSPEKREVIQAASTPPNTKQQEPHPMFQLENHTAKLSNVNLRAELHGMDEDDE